MPSNSCPGSVFIYSNLCELPGFTVSELSDFKPEVIQKSGRGIAWLDSASSIIIAKAKGNYASVSDMTMKLKWLQSQSTEGNR
jgi:ABC-type uncharacterized transport system YnjBCD substrate-binding protein